MYNYEISLRRINCFFFSRSSSSPRGLTVCVDISAMTWRRLIIVSQLWNWPRHGRYITPRAEVAAVHFRDQSPLGKKERWGEGDTGTEVAPESPGGATQTPPVHWSEGSDEGAISPSCPAAARIPRQPAAGCKQCALRRSLAPVVLLVCYSSAGMACTPLALSCCCGAEATVCGVIVVRLWRRWSAWSAEISQWCQ